MTHPIYIYRYIDNVWTGGLSVVHGILWTTSHGQAKAGQPARTYIQQLCADTKCSLEDLPGAMDNREGWQERVREIYAGDAT